MEPKPEVNPNKPNKPEAEKPIVKPDIPTNNIIGGGSLVGNASDSFNPAVLASPTNASLGAVGTMNQTLNYSFHSADTFMNIPYIERLSYKNRNRYAMSEDTLNMGRFSPLYQAQDENAGIWVRPYVTFENVPLKNGPKVDNMKWRSINGRL